MDIDTAIPCGLLINEIISNSLKHAFPGTHKSEIGVSLDMNSDKYFELIVRDNGKGIPEGFDYKKSKSLGIQLIMTLVKQLDGSIDIKKDRGTEYMITFPPLEYRKRI
jgi:two-component sensor histidine kinase